MAELSVINYRKRFIDDAEFNHSLATHDQYISRISLSKRTSAPPILCHPLTISSLLQVQHAQSVSDQARNGKARSSVFDLMG